MGSRFDRKRSTQRTRAFGHADDAVPTFTALRRVAGAVVAYRQAHLALARNQRGFNSPGVRVPRDVAQGFGRDAIELDFGRVR